MHTTIMTRYCNITKYPKIYRSQYWGTHSIHIPNGWSDHPSQVVIDNRNKFINEYNITTSIIKSRSRMFLWKIIKSLEDDASSEIDHVELYQDADKNYIVLISPYFGSEEGKHRVRIWFAHHEFKEIYPMYSLDAHSFVRKILHPNNTNKP